MNALQLHETHKRFTDDCWFHSQLRNLINSGSSACHTDWG